MIEGSFDDVRDSSSFLLYSINMFFALVASILRGQSLQMYTNDCTISAMNTCKRVGSSFRGKLPFLHKSTILSALSSSTDVKLQLRPFLSWLLLCRRCAYIEWMHRVREGCSGIGFGRFYTNSFATLTVLYYISST